MTYICFREKYPMRATYTPGLHILATFTAGNELLQDMLRCRELFDRLIAELSLQKVGETYHSFEGAGYTATVCLTESHVAIHTWPEFGKATFDVFLSNYNNDNSEKVRQFYAGVVAFFGATDIQQFELTR